jgi:hypothetical protein
MKGNVVQMTTYTTGGVVLSVRDGDSHSAAWTAINSNFAAGRRTERARLRQFVSITPRSAGKSAARRTGDGLTAAERIALAPLLGDS